MRISRRSLVLAALASVAGRAWAGPFDPAPDAGFDRWKLGFARRAKARGLPGAVVDQALEVARFLPGVIAKDRSQFEFHLAFEDYLAITNSSDRIAAGVQALRQRQGLLVQVSRRYGVEAPVIAGLWGIESFYGEKRGDVLVVSSLATLAYEGRRADFFATQLLAALKIIARGEVAAGAMTGGWAGAMGHCQVIPTTYLGFAQDFRGDGSADVWSDDPTDSLATAAWYLRQSGWQQGAAWGQEVLLPKGLLGKTTKLAALSMADWAKAGVRPARGDFLGKARAALIAPAGAGGPAFLTWANFQVMKRYNASDFYALALGLLSDRLAGDAGLVAGFPPDRFGLTQTQRIALQKRLTALGFDTGSVDGVFGPQTTAAIKGWQTRVGLAPTGLPSAELLAALP